MNLSKVKMVNYTAWKSGMVRKFSPSPLTARAKDTPKEEGKAKLTENAIVVDALVTSERNVEPNLTSTEDLRSLRLKERVLQAVKTKRQKPHKMCH